jgi:tRNA dimethylallyltransferase
MTQPRPVILAGPTASGKSALALALAERDGGCVINADASQVYACWRVLTARPDDADLARAPHRLYGHVGCAARYSAGAWLREVADEISAAKRRGQRPIIVGGTGLYLTILTEGMADIPEIPAEIRARSDDLLRAGRIDVLLDDLARLDPTTLARLDRRNPMRVQRAWDVAVATGRGLSEWHRRTSAPLLPSDTAVCIVVDPPISVINNSIQQRFSLMLEQGALDECRRYLDGGLPMDTPAARVLGAQPLMAHLQGEVSLADARDAAVVATRQFAKRQRTWFRNRMPAWPRIDPHGGDPLAAIA